MEKMNQNFLVEKWGEILEHEDLPKIGDRARALVTAQVLENTEKEVGVEKQLMQESTVSHAGFGSADGFGAAAGNDTGRAGYDPVLISMVRRAVPQMMAFDICGVQAMSAPTGLIFALKARYGEGADPTGLGVEAMFNEPNMNYSGSPVASTDGTTADTNPATHARRDIANDLAADPFSSDPFGGDSDLTDAGIPDANGTTQGSLDTAYNAGTGAAGSTVTPPAAFPPGGSTTQGMSTRQGEGDNFREMSFSIEKTAVVARTRALKAEYTLELVQDLRAVHGLDAEAELSNILSTEILGEINREVVHTVNTQAKFGAQGLSAGGGIFDAIADGQGRWSVERIKGLMLQVEREANQIAFETRRGKGNFIICSANVASAFTMAGLLDYSSSIQDNLNVDVTQGTYAGVLNGRFKVYVDPFAVISDYITVGYKGGTEMDAGLFYCPYVPVQTLRATAENTFQPKVGMKTRYGMVSNPFANGQVQTEGLVGDHTNTYYRIFKVENI